MENSVFLGRNSQATITTQRRLVPVIKCSASVSLKEMRGDCISILSRLLEIWVSCGNAVTWQNVTVTARPSVTYIVLSYWSSPQRQIGVHLSSWELNLLLAGIGLKLTEEWNSHPLDTYCHSGRGVTPVCTRSFGPRYDPETSANSLWFGCPSKCVCWKPTEWEAL